MFPVTARAGEGSPDRVGGGLPTGGQGSKVYVLCAEPKEHKRFRPVTRPGGIGFPAGRIGDRGDREIVYVPNVYVPFPAANIAPNFPLEPPERTWKQPEPCLLLFSSPLIFSSSSVFLFSSSPLLVFSSSPSGLF